MNEKCFELMEKVEKKQKLTYDEFVEIVGYGLEMQFFYKKRKFGITKFDGFEFYEWEKDEGYQNYKSLKEFADKINIDGVKVKDIWDKIYKLNFAD